jgi:hypothetical protein
VQQPAASCGARPPAHRDFSGCSEATDCKGCPDPSELNGVLISTVWVPPLSVLMRNTPMLTPDPGGRGTGDACPPAVVALQCSSDYKTVTSTLDNGCYRERT